MNCKNCGADMIDNLCSYCGTHTRNEIIKEIVEPPIKLKIRGDMNEVEFVEGNDNSDNIKIRGDMGKYKYSTNSKVLLDIRGDMNEVKMNNTKYSIVKNRGDMNDISGRA